MARKDIDDVSTVLNAQHALPPLTVARFVLTVESGPDRGLAFTVDGGAPSRAYVGKGPVCQLRLTDPKVSRRHLALDVAAAGLRLFDLGSTNGTRVNGVVVVEGVLRGGELVQLGDTSLRVEATDPTRVELPAARGFGRVVGASPEMRRLYPLCARLAASDVAVVIEGETGTGKELLAESLHEASARARGPFVVFDCAAVAPSAAEEALVAVFEQAHGGTLFIDEVAELDLAVQPKLLRAIDRGELRRPGSDAPLVVDVRVIASTRRDLDREVQAGRFRDDLFYRLAVTRIELPPLRDRRGDVALLAQHFWERLGGDGPIPYELLLRLEDASWPGNVRELQNAVARRIALGDLAGVASGGRAAGDRAAASSPGGDPIERVLALDLPLGASRDLLVDAFERRYVQRVLARHGGDVAKAAAASGIARRYFQLLRARQRAGDPGDRGG